jgi:hypothetical protein
MYPFLQRLCAAVFFLAAVHDTFNEHGFLNPA